ncbi:Rap family tetratricopeptide repeat protein [Bacillus thuringiensis]|uniref:Rap family tetratricopeptide repeat protein n=1 Tax=Bacillus thuringiensis TaxID=1428 RepID=UPI000BA1CA3B|nr:Rap family tetratricopeptide repeat protein [Bacillus thuringiensis]
MNIAVKGNEQILGLLNDWYVEIRARRISNAHRLKEEIDDKMQNIEEDQNLLLYYSLLDFRHQYVIDNLGVSTSSFDKVESFEIPSNNTLTYYYHFFKAIHASGTGSYKVAKEHFDQAEKLLELINDDVEKAEFYYKLGAFHFDICDSLVSFQYTTKAKEMFLAHVDYERNVGFCENLLGLACINLKEWSLAEEHFAAAMDKFQKVGEDKFIIMVRHNLGWMYSKQNLSSLAIRYLSEVIEKSSNHYKAMYAKALEHYKLDERDVAAELIENGLNISKKLNQEEFIHRYLILQELNNASPTQILETVVLAGIDYFEREGLYEDVQESYETLGTKFYDEKNHHAASKYFHLGLKAKRKFFEEGALK